MSTPTERRYRREARYSTQLRVTVEPATAAALEAEAEAAGLSVSAVIRDAVARGLPLVKDARRRTWRGPWCRTATRRLWCGESPAHGPQARLRPRHRANPHPNCRSGSPGMPHLSSTKASRRARSGYLTFASLQTLIRPRPRFRPNPAISALSWCQREILSGSQCIGRSAPIASCVCCLVTLLVRTSSAPTRIGAGVPSTTESGVLPQDRHDGTFAPWSMVGAGCKSPGSFLWHDKGCYRSIEVLRQQVCSFPF